jgi:N utilization substance protein A
VNPDQRPLAIGKNGQNVRLASELTEWEIDILDIGDLSEKDGGKEGKEGKEGKKEVQTIDELELKPAVLEKLKAANLTLVEQLKGLSVKDLTSVEGIGEKSAEGIVKAIKKVK